MIIGKDSSGKVRYLGNDPTQRLVDLQLAIKHIEAAIRLFTFQEPTVVAVARDRLTVSGDIPAACAVVRILDMVEVFLLPKFLARLAVRRYPQWPPLKKYKGRLLIYLRAILGL
jgi:hypothetical protein